MRIRCPECSAEAKTILRHDILSEEGSVLLIDERVWILCNQCGLEKDSDTLKKEVLIP